VRFCDVQKRDRFLLFDKTAPTPPASLPAAAAAAAATMSASPSQLTQSSKRPLEEPSSPSRATDQPDAKRPALDKVVKKDEEVELAHMPEKTPAKAEDDDDAEAETAETADKTSDKSEPTETTTPDGAAATKPVSGLESAPSADPTLAPSVHDEASWIHIRAVISSPEAATVIGKAGENVSNIRKMSGAKCTVSDYKKGAVERILTVSGIVDAVAKAFGLIIRTLNNEPLGEASTAQSKTYPLRLLIPHILIGSIIGKGGARIREIQEASGARLNASDTCLPMSSERSLVVMGVADAVHIATYYVASTLLEQLNERFNGPAASAYATRSGGPAGVVPGGMQVVPYCPQPGAGSYGNRDYYSQQPERRSAHPGAGPYGDQYGHAAPHGGPGGMAGPYGGQAAPYGGGGGGPSQNMPPYGGGSAHGGHGAHAPPHGPGASAVTQQIFIPNDMVGAIIGKGGQKINEIRQTSGSVIKINEPQDNSNERLVTITGSQECNRIALYMLYARLEQEKHRA
jgi:heterogeneous nuclear rnp K-like protein 2